MKCSKLASFLDDISYELYFLLRVPTETNRLPAVPQLSLWWQHWISADTHTLDLMWRHTMPRPILVCDKNKSMQPSPGNIPLRTGTFGWLFIAAIFFSFLHFASPKHRKWKEKSNTTFNDASTVNEVRTHWTHLRQIDPPTTSVANCTLNTGAAGRRT